MVKRVFKKGNFVCRQGNEVSFFYIVASGSANGLWHEKCCYQPGDFVRVLKDVEFSKKLRIPAGSMGSIEKCDKLREFPYTVRIFAVPEHAELNVRTH